MRTITFGATNSASLGLILTHASVEVPRPKTIKISIDGRDGEIDLTSYFGATRYENRTITLDFECINFTDRTSKFAEVTNAIHGKQCEIKFSDDDYHFNGRVNVKSCSINKSTLHFVVECDCEPYRLKASKTTVTGTLADSVIHCNNDAMPTTPTITLANSGSIWWDGTKYTLSAGTWTIPQIEFAQGTNNIGTQGTGAITIEYQEGAL